MITTEKINLDKKLFFKILVTNSFKKRIWMFLILWLISIFIISKETKSAFDIYILVISIALPLYYILWFWRFSHSDENRIFFLERYYTINEEEFIGYLNDGNHNTLKNEYFIRYLKLYNSYLLYISKSQFIYIPETSFKNSNDLNWFKNNILSKIKN